MADKKTIDIKSLSDLDLCVESIQASNNSNKDRLVLFYECNSADAWPLVGVGAYLKNNNP